MLYILRFTETGRDAQESRRKTRRDIVTALTAALADLRVVHRTTGRLVVETDGDAMEVLREVHGVLSFSPCRRVALDDLEESIVDLVGDSLRSVRSFRVSIKRVGDHGFRSAEKAAALGARLIREFPDLEVDLQEPEVTVGVEIRQSDCYVFDRVVPGADRRDHDTSPAPDSPDDVRFIVDQMLGPLSGWLRLLGFDTVYILDVPDCHLVRHARKERRVIVTQDRELSLTPAITALYLETSTLPEQLDEIAEALDLRFDPTRMFTRCSLCNRPVESIAKERIADRLPDAAYEQYDEFTMCRSCDKVYWKGGQYERILGQVRHIADASS